MRPFPAPTRKVNDMKNHCRPSEWNSKLLVLSLVPIKHEIYSTDFSLQPLSPTHPIIIRPKTRWNECFVCVRKYLQFRTKRFARCNDEKHARNISNDTFLWFGFETTKISLKLSRVKKPFPIRYTKCPRFCWVHRKTPYFWHNWYRVSRVRTIAAPSLNNTNLFRFYLN